MAAFVQLVLLLLQVSVLVLAQTGGGDTNVVSDSWIQMTTPLNAPAARQFHTSVYNPINKTMIVFGGLSGKKVLGDINSYAADLNFWTTPMKTTGTGPSARYGHSAVATGRNMMVVFGGRNATNIFNDVWVLDMLASTWVSVNFTGTPPGPRAFHAAVVDTYMHIMYIVGGADAIDYFNDVYALDLIANTWSQVTPASNSAAAAARAYHSAVINTFSVIIVFGGMGGVSQGLDDTACFDTRSRVWSHCLASNSPAGPGVRYGHTAVISPLQYMVVFGGRDSSGSAVNDVWDFDPYGYKWNAISPIGLPIDPRAYHTAIATSFGSMIVFAGLGSGGSVNNDFGLYNLASTVLRTPDDGIVLVIILSLLGGVVLALCFAVDYMQEQSEIEKDEAIEKAKREASSASVLLPKLPAIPKALHIPLGPKTQRFFDDFRASLDPLKDPPQ